MRFLFIQCVLSLISCVCSAQEYSYAHYDTREGLAGSVVYCMAQDKDGFMWFGTETGLSRFDGTQFRNFTIEDGLPDNEIVNLFVDSKNRVWIQPFSHSICYYWKGKIYNAGNDSMLARLHLGSEVFSVIENNKGELALLEEFKIQLIKPDGRIIVFDNYRNQPIIGSLAGGLKNAETFRFALAIPVEGYYIAEIAADSLVFRERLWDSAFLTRNSLYFSPHITISRGDDNLFFDLPQTGKVHRIPLPEGFLNINLLNDSLVAITSTKSVFTYNIKQQKKDKVFLAGKSISAVFEDREGNIWFSSLGEGVYKLTSTEFISYLLLLDKNPLSVNIIKKYNDVLYMGTGHFMLWQLSFPTLALTHKKIHNGFSQGRVTTIDKVGEDSMVIGTDDGMYIVCRDNFSWINVFKAVKTTYLDSVVFLAGSNIGVYIIRMDEKPVARLIYRGRVSALTKQGKNIYIGTLNGLYVLNEQNNIQYLGNVHPAFSNRVSAISTSKDGIIWIATSGSGVIGYKNGNVIKVINKKAGLSSNTCRSLFITDSILWIGTDKGLNKVTLSGSKMQVAGFTMADGLISDIINTIAIDKNQVFVGTPSGITFFNENLAMANSMCVLRVTGIRSAKHQWSYDTTNLRFSHYENNIRFEYSGISFKSAGDITYSYRLRGLDDTWQQTQDNFLHYPALPSGSYELQLLATNKFGVKSEMASISFFIDKLLWEKTWFQGLLVLLLGVLVWILVTNRIKRIRRMETVKAETTRKITELEQMALKAQMNPHFIFNSLNAIQQYVMDKDIRGANKFITDFSRLIRSTLDISSQLKITLQEEINYISTYLELEKTRFESKFNYSVKASGDIDVSNTYIPPMILQPYVENSIRHGVRYLENNEGLINIEFMEKGGFLVCVIEDNGVGRAASRQYKGKMNIEYQSKGMKLTAERIEMMNKNSPVPIYIDIEDLAANSKPQGTRVVIGFPMYEVKSPD